MNVLKGDLLALAEEGHFDVVIHGCNCFCTMGSGIAKQMKRKYPEVFIADKQTKSGDKEKLGTYSFAKINQTSQFIVVNAYTQFKYGTDKIHVDYEAVRSVFKN